jgi:predicted MFS family arabinose efflux permease
MSSPVPAPTAARERLYTRHFWIAAASHFLLGMGFWMFVVFPVHLAALGASTVRIGVLIALEPTAAVLVRMPLGALLARRGRRWMLHAGGMLNLIAVAAYPLVSDIGVGMAAIRLLHGIGIGALFTTFFTYAADIAPVTRRTEGLVVFGISGILPTALAPALGEELVLRWGFQALFLTATAFSVASLVITWWLEEPDEDVGEPTAHGFWRFARERNKWAVWATAFLFSVAMSSYVAFLEPYARSRGFERASVFFFCYSLAAVTLRVFGRSLPDRVGVRRMLVPALASLTAGLYWVASFGSLAGLGAAGLFCGMGHGYLFPILSGMAIEGTDHRARGAAMSFYTAVFDLGQMLGPPFFGLVAEVAGFPALFLFAMAGVAASLAGWIVAWFADATTVTGGP